ncbi:excinuclease ABC subunit UvrC [Anaerofustis stercorihominis]|uniref:excinuclease ABC subunit UvrC n=1 Tax=Anaerofustis stercorihominis TaxID=214853 RepID=UPI00214C4ECB|nr:excinuclease ABC subunit UvrC [Anaerofustis stercorihominis]MCR2032086.1 excinuclease ABC subunit UvrC [Anaerofustis stercorihominis]
MSKEFSENLNNKIKLLPENSGVYLMKDENGTIIYVGKAKVLKNRVTQYFRKNSNHTPKVLKMVENIADFEYIITNNEMEALILECNLIKKYRPYYNILMRDDKTYPYIKITTKDEYPKLFVTRKYINDGNKYFGPYANATYAKKAVSTINELYPIAMCKKELKSGVKKGDVCLNYHIGQCLGVCQGNIDTKLYNGYIKEIIDILNGKTAKIIQSLENKMNSYSENLDFENAGKVRDKIFAIKGLKSEQNVSNANADNMDILGLAMAEDMACVQVYALRDKKIVGRENYILKGQNEKDVSEVLSAFIKQFYTNTPFIPPLILVEKEFDDIDNITDLLTKLKSKKVEIKVPVKGEKKKLLKLATDNAKLNLENTIGKEKQKALMEKKAVEEINEYANISKEGNFRYEAYDISNTSGVDSVGVMVVFDGAKRNYKAYRKFKVKSIEGPNDYGSMVEVVFRRLNRAQKELKENDGNPRFLPLPDIIFVDGGIGHVNAVKNVVDTFNFNIKVLGLGKNNKHKLKEVVKSNEEARNIRDFEFAVKLLNDISEEVHRFAIDYHKNLRSKSFLKTTLEEIEGIGKVKCRNLLKHFKNMEDLKNAPIEEIIKVDGMNEELAKKVKDHFKND